MKVAISRSYTRKATYVRVDAPLKGVTKNGVKKGVKGRTLLMPSAYASVPSGFERCDSIL